MGRRNRHRERSVGHQPETGPETPAESRGGVPRSRMARVQVDDKTWSSFRAGLGATPASVALGRLVEREVAAARRKSGSDPDAIRASVDEARAVAMELTALIDRLEAH
jgi:hypothetical protein